MRNLLCAFLLSIVSISCFAQTYFPVGRTSDQGFKAMGLAPDSLTCAKPPGADDIKYKQFQTKMIVTVGSQMAKLNIAWAGGSINANQLYAVSDTGKFAHCLANDRKTTVIYGRVVRTIVQMNDYEVKGNASIAIVAASATVNGKTNSVDLYEIGYGESKLDSMLVDAKGFVSGTGINIDNYSKFMDAIQAAQKYATTIQNPGVEVVGYELPVDALDRSVAETFAIHQVSEGRGCEDALKRYKGKDSTSQGAIRDVYMTLTGNCGGVNEDQKREAEKLMRGLEIGY